MKFARTIGRALTLICSIIGTSSFCQVVIASNGAGNKANQVINYVLIAVQSVCYSLCALATCFVAYKIWFEPNYKISDAKHIIIGAIVFGAAGAIAQFAAS